jgi:plasmid segregation protein ParM
MNKPLEVIGIDHGWSQMKTKNHVFTSGVKEIKSEPALLGDTLEYGGRYYKIGGDRLEVKESKTKDPAFRLLTLAAIAKELKTRGGISEADVVISAGVPLTRYGEEKKELVDYLTEHRDAEFAYEGEPYKIHIEGIQVFPQCFGALAYSQHDEDGKRPCAERVRISDRKTLVVDIGSWTIDIMLLVNRRPDESMCATSPRGLITCMRSINEQCVRRLNGEVDEGDIQHVMRHGWSDLDDSYQDIIKTELESYAEKLYNSLREYGNNMKTIPIVFAGGGAAVMKNFGGLDQRNIQYVTEVRANARGYEHLAIAGLRKLGRLP